MTFKRAVFFVMALLCANGAGYSFVMEQPWLFAMGALGTFFWVDDFVAGQVTTLRRKKKAETTR